MSDEPEVRRPVPNPPEIYTYALAGQYVGATINRLINPAGANVSDRYRTQLVTARNTDELNSRLIAVLISQFGMTQQDAVSVVPSGVTPIAPLAPFTMTQECGDV